MPARELVVGDWVVGLNSGRDALGMQITGFRVLLDGSRMVLCGPLGGRTSGATIEIPEDRTKSPSEAQITAARARLLLLELWWRDARLDGRAP